MSEKELPIRHQRDPKLSPISTSYKRERAPVDHDWIPTSEVETIDVFPWILGEAVGGKYPTPVINSEFTEQVDEATAVRVYGEWQGNKNLSAEGRIFLNDIIFVFENLNKELVKTDGEIPEAFLFAGYPLEQYIQMIDDTIKDKREHRYIMEQFDHALDKFAQTWRKLAAEGPVSTKERVVADPYIDPLKRFNRNALSATTAINLAYQAPFDLAKLPQVEPEPPVVASTPPPSPPKPTIVTMAPQTPEIVVERRIPTDIIKNELIAERLIDPGDKLKPIVLVTMQRIRDDVRDLSSQADTYRIITSAKLDVGIDDKDIEILNRFTDRLLGRQ